MSLRKFLSFTVPFLLQQMRVCHPFIFSWTFTGGHKMFPFISKWSLALLFAHILSSTLKNSLQSQIYCVLIPAISYLGNPTVHAEILKLTVERDSGGMISLDSPSGLVCVVSDGSQVLASSLCLKWITEALIRHSFTHA